MNFMSDDTKDDIGNYELLGSAKLPRRVLLYKGEKSEIDAVMLVPVSPHPAVVFDDDELRTLLANAQSLTIFEKINIMVSCGTFSQQYVDTLLENLRGERKTFAQITEQLNKGLEIFLHQHAEAAAEPSTRDLAPGERAEIVERAIPRLLAPLGAGEGQKFFTAFLQRLARQIAQGGTDVIEGDLPTVFETELRDSELNKNSSDPKSDMQFIKALVRPALSKLLRNPVHPMVLYKRGVFVIALVIGRVKELHRIGVFVRIDNSENARVIRKCAFLRRVAGEVAARGQELIKLERLGPFGPIVRRTVEKTGYKNETERAEYTFYVTNVVLRDILSALRNDQRLPFLVHLLELPVRWSGTIPAAADFDNWFLNAVDFNGGLSTDDENFDHDVGQFQTRLRYSLFGFSTQVLLLKAYHLAPGPHRMSLVAELGLLDEGGVTGLTDADTIYHPPETVDLQAMLATNISDFADFLRLVEANLDNFTKE
jgi:hypothetical protein